MKHVKLAIVGSGPAGFTAAIYAARADLNPVLYEGFFSGPAGGQLMTTTEVENFPGFPEGVTGPELMLKFRQQAERFGCEIYSDDVLSVDLSQSPFLVEGKRYSLTADSLIIATGATAKRLNISGANDGELWQKGVTACAVCDGAMPIFRNKDLYVVGGGDTAMEEALFLTKFASKVYIVHRRDELRASKIMGERALKDPKIEVLWDSVVEEVHGSDVVEAVSILNLKTQERKKRAAGGLFFAIGHTPNTAFLNGQLELDETGYLVVEPGTARTKLEGVFACGDVADKQYRQAITAAGTGCMAALEAERWLSAREVLVS